MLRVLTLNLNYYDDRHGPWITRRALVEEAVRTERPDIIALQAVAKHADVEGGVDAATQLAQGLADYGDVSYHTAARFDDGREEGMAFLSRYGILSVRTHVLSHRDASEDPSKRVFLHGTFDAPSGPLHVFNAHFSWEAAQARDNVTEALAQLSWAEGPAVLAGDFNQTPDGDALGRFQSAGWTDAWAAVQPRDDGFTFFEGGALSKRTNYVLVNAPLAPRLRDARVILHDGGSVRAGRHAGVLVTLDE